MEVRVQGDSVEITGYVNAVGRESAPLRDADGYFTETIMPGAFDLSLRENPDIPMLLNHDEARVIARGNDLELREDPVGLHVRAVVNDPVVVAKAREKRLRGWSFGFTPYEQRYSEGTGIRHRTISRMRLHEVSLLDDTRRPAYPATSVYTRDDGTESPVELRMMDDYVDDLTEEREETPEPPDLTPYEQRIDALGTL